MISSSRKVVTNERDWPWRRFVRLKHYVRMESRPSKRQRRPIVLSSDDDENPILSQSTLQVSKIKPSKSGSKSKSIKDTTTDVLPTRHRANTRSTAVKSRQPTSTQADPTSSPKKPTLKRSQPQKIDNTRSLYAFFNTTDHVRPSRDEPQHERVLPGAEDEDEDEDLIEDDSYDEGFRKLPTRQPAAKSVLDRRKRHLAPTQSRAASTSLGKIPSASQKFKIPQSNSLQQPLKNTLAAPSRVDLRPWTERHGPRGLDELVVHKKKVADVQNWLENFRQGQDQKV